MADRKKKASSRKKKARSGKKRPGTARFHGTITLQPPAGGEEVGNGEHVVVSIRKLWFGKLPELRNRSEIQLDLMISTSDERQKLVERRVSSGVYYYVPDNTDLNISNWVIYDGTIRQHLSVDLEITEIENARKNTKEHTELARALVEEVSRLPIPGLDPVNAVLGAFPVLLGAILRANADDQVLKYLMSLATKEVASGSRRTLRNGVYTLTKHKPADPAQEFVKLEMEVQTVA